MEDRSFIILRTPGARGAARAGDRVRRKRARVLAASTAVALSLACGTRDALVGAEDPDEQRGKVGGGTGGGTGVAGNSTGAARSTGTAGGPPTGGTGRGSTPTGGADAGSASAGTAAIIMDGGTGGASEAPIGQGGTSSTGASGATGFMCEGAASGGGITPCELLGALDGRSIQFPCADSAGDDCDSLGYVVDGVITPCSEGQSEMVLDHPIAGVPGARYLVTMHFYGIMEPKRMGPNVTREAAFGAPDRNGGSPSPWATAPAGVSAPLSIYSAYELHVHDESGQEVAQYFLNADVDEGHWTLLIDYEKTIEVVAGGFVRLRHYDANCRVIKNCGTTAGPPCLPKVRTLDLSAVEPAPMGLMQPGLGHSAEHSGQWWLIDVTAVEAL